MLSYPRCSDVDSDGGKVAGDADDNDGGQNVDVEDIDKEHKHDTGGAPTCPTLSLNTTLPPYCYILR